jgi:hypothetical protein
VSSLALRLAPPSSCLRLRIPAWGKKWKTHSKTISKTDVVITPIPDDVRGYGVDFDLPSQFSYQCLEGMRVLVEALCLSSPTEDILVIREEYNFLINKLDRLSTSKGRYGGVVVTGQPGIGSCSRQ